MDSVIDWIKKHEGFRSKPYKDSVGVLTIGYGTNLEQGLSEKQCNYLMLCEIETCLDELNHYSWYTKQSTARKDALLNMCYNLGMPRLLSFKKMISALDVKDYATAAKEALDSKWAKQVGDRAKDVAVMIRAG
jgi:lysozyme